MDSDIEENDDEFNHRSPLPDECRNEVIGIESFYACFTSRYSACPAFFTGSLQDACQAALFPSNIEERRPVLVYIHYDKSMFSNIFCSNMFSSEIIIDYLINNYIVWPWDITFDSNKNILKEIWSNMFSPELSNIFSSEQCPMLIGIMRRSTDETSWEFPFEYEFKRLLDRDTLFHTQEKSTREILLRELIVFKEKYNENELDLSFDFIKKTRLCLEIFLEIMKYLTLNDAIKAFSDKILPLLSNYHIRLQLSDPSSTFTNMILQKMQSEQIVSLRLDTKSFWTISQFAWLTNLTSIISLSLINIQRADFIDQYELYFPNLTRLSLYYDTEVNFFMLVAILRHLQRTIKRFEIHCSGAFCAHAHWYSLDTEYIQNYTIEYLLINIGHFSLPSLNTCAQNHKSCFLMTTIDFIKKMINIRHFRLVTNRYNLENLLDENQWKMLVTTCSELKTIVVEILDGIWERKQLLQKATEIQNVLRDDRPTIRFHFVFV